MSITTFAVINCDAAGCSSKTPLIEMEERVDEVEEIRAAAGYSFLDVPFGNHKDLYICKGCLFKISGIPQ